MTDRRQPFEVVERALRRHNFGTLSTLTGPGNPHATGVVYAVAPPAAPLILYITTRTTTRKVAHIRARPDVAFVIPVPHRLIPLLPPGAIQFQATAQVLDADNPHALRAFQASWFHRRILAAEQRIATEGGDVCFIQIRPRRALFTYGIGMSVLDILRRPRHAIGRSDIPAGR